MYTSRSFYYSYVLILAKVLSDQCTKHFRRCNSSAKNPAFKRTFIAMATACSPVSNSETTYDTYMRDSQTPTDSSLQHKLHCHMYTSFHLQKYKAQNRGVFLIIVHKALRLPTNKQTHLGGKKESFTLQNNCGLFKDQKEIQSLA